MMRFFFLPPQALNLNDPFYKTICRFLYTDDEKNNVLLKLTSIVSLSQINANRTDKSTLLGYLNNLFLNPPRLPSDTKQQTLLEIFNALIDATDDSFEQKQTLKLQFEGRILMATSKMRESALESVKQLSPEQLYHLTDRLPFFKTFCETDPTLLTHWRVILKNTNLPPKKLSSIEGKENLCEFAQFIGLHLQSALDELKKIVDEKVPAFTAEVLKKGCELGIYNMLKFRCEANQMFLQEGSEDFDKIAAEVLHDVNKLLIYGAPGYYAAANALLFLSDYATGEAQITYEQRAVKYICNAYILEHSESTQEIFKAFFSAESLPPEHEVVSNLGMSMADYQKIYAMQLAHFEALKLPQLSR